jgi:hypothetical protein
MYYFKTGSKVDAPPAANPPPPPDLETPESVELEAWGATAPVWRLWREESILVPERIHTAIARLFNSYPSHYTN